MSAVIADTHAIMWYLSDPKRLSPTAEVALDTAVASGEPIYVASITLVELRYLIEKGRLASTVWDAVVNALADPNGGVRLESLDLAVASELGVIPRGVVPEMPDRIIAATAHYLGLPLFTADHKVHAAGIAVIW